MDLPMWVHQWKKCILWGGTDAVMEGGYAHARVDGMWKITVLSPQFCCERNTQKNKF